MSRGIAQLIIDFPKKKKISFSFLIKYSRNKYFMFHAYAKSLNSNKVNGYGLYSIPVTDIRGQQLRFLI